MKWALYLRQGMLLLCVGKTVKEVTDWYHDWFPLVCPDGNDDNNEWGVDIRQI